MAIGFASAETIMFIRHEFDKPGIVPLKSNRKVALSLADQTQGQSVRVDPLPMVANPVREIGLEGIDFSLVLVKPVFINEDDSTGILYLVSSDTSRSDEHLTTIDQKRWNVACYHQSLKQNAALAKSPTQPRATPTNHFFASLYAYLRLESLTISTRMNHLALKNKLYLKAVQQAVAELPK